MNKNYCGANIKDFKVGDKVICIDVESPNPLVKSLFKINCIYTVRQISPPFIYVKGKSIGILSERFKKANAQLELF